MKTESLILCVIFYIAIMVTVIFWGMEDAHSDIDCTKVVVHHSESGDVSAAEIDRWHRERGWDCIGYHFVIRADGHIEEGRFLSKLGAHAKGRNDWMGVCLTGRDNFTSAQIAAFKSLCKRFNVKHVERHHEKCPGKGFPQSVIDEISGGAHAN